jgi:hypothetical protein
MAWNLDDYEPVSDRIVRFRNDHAESGIETELVGDLDGTGYRFKCTVTIKSEIVATGWAEEIIGSSPVNKTNALENAETSAVGRALQNLGYVSKAGGPTREQMQQVADEQKETEQRNKRRQLLREKIGGFDEEQKKHVQDLVKEKKLPSLLAELNEAQLKKWEKLLNEFRQGEPF